MHEASLVDALMDELARAVSPHPLGAVRLVRLRVGERSGVEPELLAIAFEVARAPRGLPEAALELVHEPARWACPICETTIPNGEILVCPGCGEPALLRAGDALILERVELEVRDV